MKGSALLLLLLAFAPPCLAAEPPIRVELNAAEPVQNRCRLSFVLENQDASAIASLKLDLVVFGKDGVIDRRLVAEMGPLRAAKTTVKTFELDDDCAHIGSILVNDVAACAPPDAGACLDRLVSSSRLPKIRLFK